MEPGAAVLLAAAGALGGAVNAIAGGGTFFTFPALIAAGLDPLTANVSNAVAIYPGHAAAVPAYRAELAAAGRVALRRGAVAALGGLAGAALLLWAGAAVFAGLVPWLLLAATALFAAGPALGRAAARLGGQGGAGGLAVVFVFCVYGGYFGAGLGVLLMAALAIVGVADLQQANAQKNLIATVVTTVSVAVFVAAGAVAWPQTIVVMAGAAAGGYGGARLARRVPARLLRGLVVAVGLALSAWYFAAG